jgi:hypothetical protein
MDHGTAQQALTDCFSAYGTTPLNQTFAAEFKRYQHYVERVLRQARKTQNKELERVGIDLRENQMMLSMRGETVGYYIGVLVGAFMMGASREKLDIIGDGIYHHLTQRRP